MARKVVHRVRVWGYPATEDLNGPIKWAWACTGCGAHKGNLPRDKAEAQGFDHGDTVYVIDKGGDDT